eukprot:gene5623-6486_t
MSEALNATGRPIYFSICSWGTNSPWKWGYTAGNSWRTTKDIKDTWESFLYNLEQQIPLTSYAQIGGWNEVIAINQDPMGKSGQLVRSINSGLQQIWARPLADGSIAVVLFNADDSPADIVLQWSDVWTSSFTELVVRDLWARSNNGTYSVSFSAYDILPHGSTVVVIMDPWLLSNARSEKNTYEDSIWFFMLSFLPRIVGSGIRSGNETLFSTKLVSVTRRSRPSDCQMVARTATHLSCAINEGYLISYCNISSKIITLKDTGIHRIVIDTGSNCCTISHN